MSSYKAFIKCFPDRCGKLLDLYFKDAEQKDLEITLLLSIATAALIVPFGRLTEESHPSGDREKFVNAKNALDAVLAQKFIGSSLWPGNSTGSWKFGLLNNIDSEPDMWPVDEFTGVGEGEICNDIIKTLRNALAHGNIFFRGNPCIDRLIFLSRIHHRKPELGYRCVVVTPLDLKTMINKWFMMINDLKLPEGFFENSSTFE